MNIPFPSRGQVEYTRSCFPSGTRIILNSMNDPYAPPLNPEREAPFGMWTMPVRSVLPGTTDAACR